MLVLVPGPERRLLELEILLEPAKLQGQERVQAQVLLLALEPEQVCWQPEPGMELELVMRQAVQQQQVLLYEEPALIDLPEPMLVFLQ